METIIKDLIAEYNWEDIEPVLFLLYPTPKRSITEYAEAYQKFIATVAIKTSMRLVIEENHGSTFGKWHKVYGKNGTLVKELFQNENARQYFKDTWESEQKYALSYTDWSEIAGMTIDAMTLSEYSEKEIVVYVLVEITSQWRSDEQDLKVSEELKTITEGQEQNVVPKEMVGESGFRQVWSENEDSEFHGLYTVYWENDIIQQQGIIINDNKEGVWTYWDKNGKIEKQIRYWCDREMEEKSESPWWSNSDI